jgi:hypothetical protein
MSRRSPVHLPFLLFAALLLPACTSGIAGQVRMVDNNNQPIANAPLENIVVNMINTSAALEQASYSVKTDAKGHYASESDRIKPGIYKVEASEPGYMTATTTVEVKRSTSKVNLDLKQLPKGSERTFRGMDSDKDKIINPGEVNIEPPSM